MAKKVVSSVYHSKQEGYPLIRLVNTFKLPTEAIQAYKDEEPSVTSDSSRQHVCDATSHMSY